MALKIHWSALLVASCDVLERVAPLLHMHHSVRASSVTAVAEEIDNLVVPAILVALERRGQLLRHLGALRHWALCMA